MKRNIDKLTGKQHDLLVIGGGIYGATIARAASLRNMKVALVDKQDFGQATSANSLKIMHGGLRYLQHFDLFRMRESIRSRRRLLRLAPHLVKPRPFTVPTYGHGRDGKGIMRIALFLNDLISWDRNRLVPADRRVPRGRTLSRAECKLIMPGVNEVRLTGAAQWFECTVSNTDRLNLEFVLSADDLGATIANYVKVNRLIIDEGEVVGVAAEDMLGSKAIDIHARLVVDATGPWMGGFASSLEGRSDIENSFEYVKAVNLVVSRRLFGKSAVGLKIDTPTGDSDALFDKGGRYYFFVPWRSGTLIGTSYVPFHDSPGACRADRHDVQGIIDDVNKAYPEARLRISDVCFWHAGILPAQLDSAKKIGGFNLRKTDRIIDYEAEYGLKGLIGVQGVKYTTAPIVADRVATLALARLGRRLAARPPDPPLIGGCALAPHTQECPDSSVLNHIILQHGSNYESILGYANDYPESLEPLAQGLSTITAEVLHAVREEMAVSLLDVIMRRTELGTFGYPGDAAVAKCAEIMGRELDWDDAKIALEIAAAKATYDLPAKR